MPIPGWEVSVAKSLWGKVGPWLWSRLRSGLVGRRFKQVFGRGVEGPGFTLVYAELALAPALAAVSPFPYVKPGGNPQAGFSISRPVSLCELRAAGYLASAIGDGVGRTPALRSDADVRALFDLDFVSFGGPESNFKSRDCQVNPGNRLARFDQQVTQFLDLNTKNPLAVCSDPNFDYGLILKVRPSQFPNRAWLMCAGFGEWGTSGAAWYLANRWEDIRKEAKGRPFALVLRISPPQDQSAEPIVLKVGRE
jgi:hypothetical protein